MRRRRRFVALLRGRGLEVGEWQAWVWRSGGGFHCCNEPIPFSCNRFNENRLLSGIAQCLADFPNSRVNACLDVDEYVLTPQPTDDVVTRDEQTSTFDQHDQHVHRLALESNRTAIAAQLIRRHIKLEVAKAIYDIAVNDYGMKPEDLIWGLFMNRHIFPGADASLPAYGMIKAMEKSRDELRICE